MANVRTSIDIEAPVQEVWGLVTDLDRLGEWVSIHRVFPEPPPEQVHQGTSFRQTLAVAGTSFPVEWTAIDVDGPQRLAWEGAGPAGATARTTYSLTEQNGGTRFEYENDFRLPAGEIGGGANGGVSRHAGREADEALFPLKQLG